MPRSVQSSAHPSVPQVPVPVAVTTPGAVGFMCRACRRGHPGLIGERCLFISPRLPIRKARAKPCAAFPAGWTGGTIAHVMPQLLERQAELQMLGMAVERAGTG